jgi:hypothetical protein
MSDVVCSHLDEIAVRELPASVGGCEDCLRTGGTWLHLPDFAGVRANGRRFASPPLVWPVTGAGRTKKIGEPK